MAALAKVQTQAEVNSPGVPCLSGEVPAAPWARPRGPVVPSSRLSKIPESAPTRVASPSCFLDLVCPVGHHRLIQVWTCPGGSPRQGPDLGHGKWPPTTIPTTHSFPRFPKARLELSGAFLQISSLQPLRTTQAFPEKGVFLEWTR